MKYLKKYSIFESRTDDHYNIMDICQEIFDEFDFIVPDHVKKYPTQHNLSAHSERIGNFDIEDTYHFGAKCLRIRITESSTYRTTTIKPGCFKNFEGLINDSFKNLLEDAHNRIIKYLNPVQTIVGSLGSYTKDLDLLYFYEKPNFKRYKGVEIYGSNIAVSLDKLGIEVLSNSRHRNGFDAYKNNQIVGMYYMMGYYDNWFYYEDISRGEKTPNDLKLNNWIKSEWKKVCSNLKITDFQTIRNINNPKITTAEFMSILKKNQDNYE